MRLEAEKRTSASPWWPGFLLYLERSSDKIGKLDKKATFPPN
jgi:hypothetical protein